MKPEIAIRLYSRDENGVLWDREFGLDVGEFGDRLPMVGDKIIYAFSAATGEGRYEP